MAKVEVITGLERRWSESRSARLLRRLWSLARLLPKWRAGPRSCQPRFTVGGNSSATAVTYLRKS
jgi:hypothetical protein